MWPPGTPAAGASSRRTARYVDRIARSCAAHPHTTNILRSTRVTGVSGIPRRRSPFANARGRAQGVPPRGDSGASERFALRPAGGRIPPRRKCCRLPVPRNTRRAAHGRVGSCTPDARSLEGNVRQSTCAPQGNGLRRRFANSCRNLDATPVSSSRSATPRRYDPDAVLDASNTNIPCSGRVGGGRRPGCPPS